MGLYHRIFQTPGQAILIVFMIGEGQGGAGTINYHMFVKYGNMGICLLQAVSKIRKVAAAYSPKYVRIKLHGH